MKGDRTNYEDFLEGIDEDSKFQLKVLKEEEVDIVEKLLNKLEKESDPKKRAALYFQIETIRMEYNDKRRSIAQLCT